MKTKPKTLAIILIILIAVLIVLGIVVGSVKIKVPDIVSIILGKGTSRNTIYIVKNLRLPRVLCAVLSGAALALCGLIFQSVFRNPMADSYILGISSGASFAVGLTFVAGISLSNISLPFISFFGAIITTILLFLISKRNTFSLLLTGIALNYLLSSLTTLTIYISDKPAENILFWTLGNLGNASWSKLIIIAFVLCLTTIITMKNSTAMDLLLMDDSTALSSGLNVEKTRILLLILASILTATVVCFCGIIGFIGLMSPHFVRLLLGPKHKTLIPISMLMGSTLMLFSDLVSRTIAAPSELPIGLITSIMGAPLFLFLLKRKRHE
ncbi:MAG: iron ABC transporter permease [Sphaerochaetaceae bacterium]|nr:iron ABC transporter permease [Sphaerochaetaceae bacterium]